MRSVFLSISCLFSLGFAWSVMAQTVPRINYFTHERELFVDAFPGEKFQATWSDLGTLTTSETASVVRETGSGSVTGIHKSTATDLLISASLESSWNGTAEQNSFSFRGSSGLLATFTVSHMMTGTLDATVELSGIDGVSAIIALTEGPFLLDGFYREFDDRDINTGKIEVSEPVTLVPGTLYGFSAYAKVSAAVFDGAKSGIASVDISLNVSGEDGGGSGTRFADQDQDGLPDIWETTGINVDADEDIEIDLPGLGVRPGRQDLIVEVDVQSGSNFPLDVLSDVVDAFSTAPVENPDGSTGITLHLLIDETSLPPLIYPNAGLRSVVADQKLRFFGTPEERADPEWAAIREAKLQSMRYAVIGGERANGSSGWGEVLGDDFIVTMENFTGLNQNDYAGTFMHELGHNLGLRHGGGDSVQYKPNYLSVMSYLFQMETQMSERIPWALDFSSNQLATLDENGTLESEGFGPVAPTGGLRFTVYNAGAPNFSPIPQGVEVLASVPVDFNFNGEIDTVRTPLDLNRISEDVDPSPGERLRGHNDWANLSLAFNTSGNFGDGVGGGSGPAGDLDPEVLEMLRQVFASLPDITSNDNDGSEAIPGQYRLDQNYPNPFNPTTTISYNLPRAGKVTLRVYDVLGRQVRELASGTKPAGTYEVSFDATSLPSGIYLYRLRAGKYVETKRMVIVK